MAQQARVVLRDTALEQGEKLLVVTKLGSLTELINVSYFGDFQKGQLPDKSL